MKVYVIDKNGKALMPTKRFGKVRKMLKQKKARVVQRKPFTIQLLFETTSYTQELTLGMDSGYKHIGISVVSEKRNYYLLNWNC